MLGFMEQTKTISSLSNIDSEITPDIQFINILDTNHEDTGIYQEVYDNIPYLHDIGVKHLFIEMPIEFNQAIEKFQEEYSKQDSCNELLKQNLKDYISDNSFIYNGDINSTIELVSKSTKYGIKVYAADKDDNLAKLSDKYPDEMKMIMSSDEDYVDKLKEMPLFESLWQRVKYGYVYTRFMMGRMDVDKEVSSMVKDFAQDDNGNPERAAILFGVYHSVKKEDIDEHLGKDKTLSVAIYRDSDQKDESIRGLKDFLINESNIDAPQYEIFLNSAKQLGKLDCLPSRQCYQR